MWIEPRPSGLVRSNKPGEGRRHFVTHRPFVISHDWLLDRPAPRKDRDDRRGAIGTSEKKRHTGAVEKGRVRVANTRLHLRKLG